ncbi:LysR family transcriptional regulator [Massilia sp. TWR1-2-2]|uniref:LysR family transcriptional regulator n=1 Tax=Massilia sp. TWR1-2-2 TaxID=2804584 RepID=UPI003CF3124C
MHLKQLRYFLALAQEGSFSRASAQLHMAQPPLTRQIHGLEEELGTTLFIRTPHGVELTGAGEVMRQEAPNILAMVKAAREKTQYAGKGYLGRLDVGIFGSGNDGLRLVVGQEVEDVLTGIALVSARFGRCITTASATSPRLPGVLYRPLDPQWLRDVELCVLYRQNAQSPILHAFLDIMQSRCWHRAAPAGRPEQKRFSVATPPPSC